VGKNRKLFRADSAYQMPSRENYSPIILIQEKGKRLDWFKESCWSSHHQTTLTVRKEGKEETLTSQKGDRVTNARATFR